MPRVNVYGLQSGPQWTDVEAAIQVAIAGVEGLYITKDQVTVYPYNTQVPCLHLPVQVEIRLVARPERKRELLVQMNTAVKRVVQEIANRYVVSEVRTIDESDDIIDYVDYS